MDVEYVTGFNISAPGKIILYGEHSVVYGKTAVAGSINLKTQLSFSTISTIGKKRIVLNLPSVGANLELNVKELNHSLMDTPVPLLSDSSQAAFCLGNPENINFDALVSDVRAFIKMSFEALPPEKENAIAAFLCILVGMFTSVNISLASFHIKVTSELQIGAGMGSSTAYNVCLAAAFLNYIRINVLKHKKDMKNISKKGYKTFEYWEFDLERFDHTETDLISRWALLGDKVMHGNPSGIDNAVCTFGSVLEFKKGERGNSLKMISDPKHLKLLLINTNVPRNTKKLVEFVASRRNQFMSVVEPILDAMDSVATMAAATLRRLGQLTCVCNTEYAECAENISSEILKLEVLAEMNQKMLEALGVSHESLDFVCKTARKEDLHAKLTGAGGGGYAFLIIPHKGRKENLLRFKTLLQDEGFQLREVSLGGPGVQVTQRCESHGAEGDGGENQELPLSISSDESYPPDFSCSFQSDMGDSVHSHQKDLDKFPGPENYKSLLKMMLDSQKKMEQDKREEPADSKPVDYSVWKERVSSVWGNILKGGKQPNWNAAHKGTYKIGDKIIPVAPEIQADINLSDTIAKAKESPEQWPVWTRSMGERKSPFEGPLQWLNEQFPIEEDKSELQRVSNRAQQQLKAIMLKQHNQAQAKGYCKHSGTTGMALNQKLNSKDHFYFAGNEN